ncbi:uncharacterized protein LOC115882305 isoform X3 [Sitophilus oryzae]|uniref:Uncharacterized protein LOC115882305 isoform X3 n=1 Tax=Sitophilus oryzae TaxID=7048 RepID=A0A6J2XYK0_SITOR|nr:uncharacterized protein LOC115882305 isoform X3 [Sitophilus oryzae]
MNRIPGINDDIHLNFITDSGLADLMNHAQKLLQNKKLIQALPDNGRHIRSRLEKLLLEAHQRRFWICLEELHSIFEYNAKRREYVERWMRNFDVNNQEEIELDKITQDCKRSRSLPRYIPNYYHYTVCRPSR